MENIQLIPVGINLKQSLKQTYWNAQALTHSPMPKQTILLNNDPIKLVRYEQGSIVPVQEKKIIQLLGIILLIILTLLLRLVNINITTITINVIVNIYWGFLYDLFYMDYPIKRSWQSYDVGTTTIPTFTNVKATV